MANLLGDLIVRLGADIADFRADLGRATDEARRQMGNIERHVDDARRSFRNLGRGLVAGLSVAALAAFTKAGIETAEELNEISKRIGVSVENLSVLRFAVEQSGGSFDVLVDGLEKLSIKMAKAGISGEDTIGMLKMLAERVQATESPFKRLQIATEAFGKAAGPKLVEFLSQGEEGIEALRAKAREMGFELSGRAAQAADDFQDKMAGMEMQISRAAVALGEGFVAAFDDFKGGITDPAVLDGLRAIGETLGEVARFAYEYADAIGIAAGALTGAAFGGVPGALIGGGAAAAGIGMVKDRRKAVMDDRAMLDSLKKQVGEYRDTLAKMEGDPEGRRLGIERQIKTAETAIGGLEEKLKALGDASGAATEKERAFVEGLGRDKGEKRARRRGGRAKEEKDVFAEAMEGLNREIALVGELTNAEKILYETQQGRYRTLTEAQKQTLVGAAQQLDAATAAEQQERKSAQALDEMEASARELLEPVDELDRAFFEYNKQLEDLETLLEAGRLSQDEFSAAAANLKRQFEETNLAESLKEQTVEMEELMREAARDMQNTFSDLFFDIMQGKFDDFGARFKAMIDRMVADWLASQLVRGIFGEGFAEGKGGADIGGILGGIFKLFGGGPGAGGTATEPAVVEALDVFAKGGVFAGGKVIPFARGGMVGERTMFPMGLMGEAGPEAILPLKRVAGGKLGVMADLSEHTQVTKPGDTIVNFNLPGVRDDSTFIRSVGQSARNAAQLLDRASRRNG